jgi:GntP family gluconate:H+ symporter
MDTDSVVKATINGAGKTLGAVGIIIALGAMLGKIRAAAQDNCRSSECLRLHGGS